MNKTASTLTPGGRAHVAEKNFVFPKTRRYPIHDLSHARAALSMVAKHGTDSEKYTVRSAVSKKYPSLANGSDIRKIASDIYQEAFNDELSKMAGPKIVSAAKGMVGAGRKRILSSIHQLSNIKHPRVHGVRRYIPNVKI